ncbi:MAG: hypothetical protein LBC74_14225 [Planctomycetaceae bacterium]|jgi:hypothetical protein|nr:hypothetical protein [Planctomycetaceae bacterium]
MSQTSENIDENNVSTDPLDVLKQEILAIIDEKFDIEAVVQMVEQLDFSKKLNVSLQKSFQSLQADLQRKEQMIQYLQGRLNNLELDIALLKRTVVSPYPFPPVPQPVQQTPVCPKVTTSPIMEQPTKESQTNDNRQDIRPPDFSKLRAMTVPEPTNKFVPSLKSEQETIVT